MSLKKSARVLRSTSRPFSFDPQNKNPLADAEAMRVAGATGIGASASVAIVTGKKGEGY